MAIITSLLHLGAGKIEPYQIGEEDYYKLIVHVDIGYKNGLNHSIKEIEEAYLKMINAPEKPMFSKEFYFAGDIFDFLYTYKFKFNKIIANRIFEHMFYDSGQIGQLLDACNQITRDDATLDIIVPDFDETIKTYTRWQALDHLANVGDKVLLINTELCNTRCDPHGSIWSESLARYYFQNEGTWKIDSFEPVGMYKCRTGTYMKILCAKPEHKKG